MKKIAGQARKLSDLISSAALEANVLVSLAAATLLVKILLLNKLPQPFAGAFELGVVAEAVLASIVASYVFYLLVVHLPEHRAKMLIEPFVKKHLTRIVGDGMAIVHDIGQSSGTELNFLTCTKEELQASLKRIEILSESPLVIGPTYRPANWLEFFAYRVGRTRSSAQKLMQRITILNAKRIKLITDIDDCNYFNMVESYVHQNTRAGSTLEFISDVQHKYLLLCRELHELERMQ